MAKINYNKVENEINQALRAMYTKKLLKGESIVSKRAVSFYNMDTGPHPKPRDAVVDELEAIEREEAEQERLEQEQKREAALRIQQEREAVLEGLQAHASENEEVEKETLIEETKEETPPQEEIITAPPVIKERENVPTLEDSLVAIPPFLILRRLILWMKKRQVADLYKLLGTTEEEINVFKSKTSLTPQEEKRVVDILEKGKEVKKKLLKKLGLDQDQNIVDKEYKKQKDKKLNIRDTWLPL